MPVFFVEKMREKLLFCTSYDNTLYFIKFNGNTIKSIKNVGRVIVLDLSAHLLIMLYINTRFGENI